MIQVNALITLPYHVIQVLHSAAVIPYSYPMLPSTPIAAKWNPSYSRE